LAKPEWPDSLFNLILIGSPGTGKTHIALAEPSLFACSRVVEAVAGGILRLKTGVDMVNSAHHLIPRRLLASHHPPKILSRHFHRLDKILAATEPFSLKAFTNIYILVLRLYFFGFNLLYCYVFWGIFICLNRGISA